MSVSKQIEELSTDIKRIDYRLNEQISQKYKHLLDQASYSHDLQDNLHDIETQISALHGQSSAIKHKIDTIYSTFKDETQQLHKFHSTCRFLRSISLFLEYLRLFESTNNIVLCAKYLNELLALIDELLLARVDVVLNNRDIIQSRKQKLIQQVTAQLFEDIQAENREKIELDLQVFIHLNELKDILEKVTHQKATEITATFKKIFVESQPNDLWKSLGAFFNQKLLVQCRQMIMLQNLLMDSDKKITTVFWNRIMEVMVREIANHQKIYEHEYPQFLKLLTEFLLKMDHDQFTSRNLEKWEHFYVAKVRSNFLDRQKDVFNENGSFNHKKINELIRVITSDLSFSLVNDRLNEEIAKNVLHCMQTLTVKTREKINEDPDASNTVGIINAAQKHNIKLANSMVYVQQQLTRVITNMSNSFPKNTISLLNEGNACVNQVVIDILRPITDAISKAIEQILNTIHLECDWNRLQAKTNQCSPYMRELVGYIQRAHNVHLSQFEKSNAYDQCVKDIVEKCVELFVRHCVLIKPISNGGRSRLTVDCNQLEKALTLLYPQFQTMGFSYRLLKSIEVLINDSPEEIVKSHSVGSSLPLSVILLLLFLHGGNEFSSPFDPSKNVKNDRNLAIWFDRNVDEKIKLQIIAGAVQKYSAGILSRKMTTFDPVYVHIVNLLKQNKYLN